MCLMKLSCNGITNNQPQLELGEELRKINPKLLNELSGNGRRTERKGYEKEEETVRQKPKEKKEKGQETLIL